MNISECQKLYTSITDLGVKRKGGGLGPIPRKIFQTTPITLAYTVSPRQEISIVRGSFLQDIPPHSA